MARLTREKVQVGFSRCGVLNGCWFLVSSLSLFPDLQPDRGWIDPIEKLHRG